MESIRSTGVGKANMRKTEHEWGVRNEDLSQLTMSGRCTWLRTGGTPSLVLKSYRQVSVILTESDFLVF